jgi:hypothetical protein
MKAGLQISIKDYRRHKNAWMVAFTCTFVSRSHIVRLSGVGSRVSHVFTSHRYPSGMLLLGMEEANVLTFRRSNEIHSPITC